MALLVKHGTWVIIPAGLALAFVYTHVYAKIYPFLVARSLAQEDVSRRLMKIRVVTSRRTAPVRPAAESAKAS